MYISLYLFVYVCFGIRVHMCIRVSVCVWWKVILQVISHHAAMTWAIIWHTHQHLHIHTQTPHISFPLFRSNGDEYFNPIRHVKIKVLSPICILFHWSDSRQGKSQEYRIYTHMLNKHPKLTTLKHTFADLVCPTVFKQTLSNSTLYNMWYLCVDHSQGCKARECSGVTAGHGEVMWFWLCSDAGFARGGLHGLCSNTLVQSTWATCRRSQIWQVGPKQEQWDVPLVACMSDWSVHLSVCVCVCKTEVICYVYYVHPSVCAWFGYLHCSVSERGSKRLMCVLGLWTSGLLDVCLWKCWAESLYFLVTLTLTSSITLSDALVSTHTHTFSQVPPLSNLLYGYTTRQSLSLTGRQLFLLSGP